MASETQVVPEIVSVFTAAAEMTFQELTGTDVTLSNLSVSSGAFASADVFAAIELRRLSPGMLICAFSLAALENLSRRYLPAGIELSPDMLDDTAGEFANVIAGQAKTILKGTLYHYLLSTPIVTRSDRFVRPGSAAGIELQFDCDCGYFWLWVNISAENDS